MARDHDWFIEATDADINEAIARALQDSGSGSEDESLLRNVVCADGSVRNLWQVPYELTKFFWESRRRFGSVRIYNRNVGQVLADLPNKGKIYEVTFLFSKKKKKKS